MSSVRKENPFGRKAAKKRKDNPFSPKRRKPTLDELAATAELGDEIAEGIFVGYGRVLTGVGVFRTPEPGEKWWE